MFSVTWHCFAGRILAAATRNCSQPVLLAGDTLVLRPSPLASLTVLRISEYICELVPPGVFNVVNGGHDLWVGPTSNFGIDLITFTRSANTEKPASESLGGTLGVRECDSRAITDAGRIALFGNTAVVPVIRKPGRYGLASTLFDILSFQPMHMKTQVLVWSLARKASYTFPIMSELLESMARKYTSSSVAPRWKESR